MKRSFLLPSRWKVPLLLLFAASSILLIANSAYSFEFSALRYHVVVTNGIVSSDNLTDEVALSGFILFALALSLCAERVEDEYINAIRLSSWQIAILVNFGLLIVSIWSFYNLQFLGIVFYNVLTPLIIYLVVFYLRLRIIPIFRKRTVV